MIQTLQKPILIVFSKLNKIQIWIGVFALIIGVSVLQDYIFSRLKDTGFYISESLLYNSIWIFIIPFSYVAIKSSSNLNVKNKMEVFFLLLKSCLLSLLHIFIFVSFFVFISYIVYSPSHRFIRIFKTTLSNEFSILILYYFALPFAFKFYKRYSQRISNNSYPKIIKVKKGLKTLSIKTNNIEIISTEKPYTVITVGNINYFDNRTLKELETIFNPKTFYRVNRSVIINKNFIKELESRKNGDYDAFLFNDKVIRLSRHYRARWKNVLH